MITIWRPIMTEFAIHQNLSMHDFYTIKSILEGVLKKGSDDINEIKSIISIIDKIDSLITEFEKEK